MPNLYATPTEIKAATPDGIRSATTKYDQLLLRVSEQVSRFFDRHCGRVFYPSYAVRYFDGRGKKTLRIAPSDLLSLTSVEVSDDDGLNYRAVTLNTDFRPTWWGDHNDPRSWTQLVIDPNGSESAWPSGHRSVKVTGVWAYADDRDAAWQSSADTVQSNPLAVGATSLVVTDADGVDILGVSPRFQAGHLLRIESEFAYCSVVTVGTNTLTIARARNGTTAAQHAQGKAIDVWRPPGPVNEAAIIQAMRLLQRGLQGFGDARANAELGQMIYLRALDPEARALLEPYRIARAG